MSGWRAAAGEEAERIDARHKLLKVRDLCGRKLAHNHLRRHEIERAARGVGQLMTDETLVMRPGLGGMRWIGVRPTPIVELMIVPDNPNL